ncbi:MAG: hypothetical protein FJZ95_03235 [Chloroflexi bacterium]|nr:hypothetical protein [Chloroflexota bacterium]
MTLIVLSTGCAHPGGSDRSIGSIARPFEFNQTKWETDALSHRLWESLKPASRDQIDDSEVVKEYFRALSSQGSDKADLENRAERILAKQIRGVLIDEGIFNPLDTFIPLKIVFPPVSFEFESPPSLLVVSPREEIKLLKRRTLEPGLSVAQKEEIESEVDGLGYSSLVVGLGGVGFTVPTMVYETTDIRHAIDIAVEEWFHQYMFFQPLGFNYALDSLGWRTNPDIATMNETVAGIVSKEIGEKVYSKYYAPVEEEPPPPAGPSEFSLLMREIRINVDRLLAEGKATQAEEYMRERRDFLASKGYYIRKLNQAYFAFHGTYADEPTTVSPIGKDLQKLRADSSSLGEFLNEVKTMTNYEDLKRAIQ